MDLKRSEELLIRKEKWWPTSFCFRAVMNHTCPQTNYLVSPTWFVIYVKDEKLWSCFHFLTSQTFINVNILATVMQCQFSYYKFRLTKFKNLRSSSRTTAVSCPHHTFPYFLFYSFTLLFIKHPVYNRKESYIHLQRTKNIPKTT